MTLRYSEPHVTEHFMTCELSSHDFDLAPSQHIKVTFKHTMPSQKSLHVQQLSGVREINKGRVGLTLLVQVTSSSKVIQTQSLTGPGFYTILPTAVTRA